VSTVPCGDQCDALATGSGFKLLPVMVYRVFVDGRPDELIRGVDIIGTSLTKILAAGDDFGVFNGSCGAESGWVPVSAVSPSLLLQQIEVATRRKRRRRSSHPRCYSLMST
jgi:hypothetical protein